MEEFQASDPGEAEEIESEEISGNFEDGFQEDSGMDVAQLLDEPDDEEEFLGSTENRIVSFNGKEISRTPLLSAKEEIEIAHLIEAGCEKAREKMIASNLRLVIDIAKRYQNRGLPFSDLIQEGSLGLMRAVEKFKVSKGCKFSTYATWWIRQFIVRGIQNNFRTVRLPIHVNLLLREISKAEKFLLGKNGEPAGIREVANHLGLDEKKVVRALPFRRPEVSLDEPLGLEEDFTLLDTIKDYKTFNPESWTSFQQLQEFYLTAMKETLSFFEAGLLVARLQDWECLSEYEKFFPQATALISKLKGYAKCSQADVLEAEIEAFFMAPEETKENRAKRETVIRLMRDCLTRDEIEILLWWHGNGGETFSLDSIGILSGVTRERIRQKEVAIKKKLLGYINEKSFSASLARSGNNFFREVPAPGKREEVLSIQPQMLKEAVEADPLSELKVLLGCPHPKCLYVLKRVKQCLEKGNMKKEDLLLAIGMSSKWLGQILKLERLELESKRLITSTMFEGVPFFNLSAAVLFAQLPTEELQVEAITDCIRLKLRSKMQIEVRIDLIRRWNKMKI